MKATYVTPHGTSFELKVSDVGTKGLYLFTESLGPVGVARADSWEQAYECAVSDFMHEADPDYVRECMESEGIDPDSGELPEGFHYRDGGGIASEDLNGSSIDGPLQLEQIDGTTFIAKCSVGELEIRMDPDDFDFDDFPSEA